MSSVLALGHDIVEIARIQAAYERYGRKFLDKVYSPQEQIYCLQQKNPYPSLAARFAVKEAVAKALGCGIGKRFTWKSVATTNDAHGKPQAFYDSLGKTLLQELGVQKTLLSITHTQTLASAVVILVR
ncbi:MAG: holo-ACP synthase [Verrucomicrobiota bacterium]|nr:MAG: holo-ACP synthase [Verrucomicrobiota bacterium]